MYQQYLIELPQTDSRLLNAKTARSVYGAAIEHASIEQVDRFLLAARDAQGQPLQRQFFQERVYAAPAPVIIGGADRKVILTGLGSVGVGLLNRHLVTIANALSVYTKSAWTLKSYSGDCTITPYGTRMYFCPTFVVTQQKRLKAAILARCPLNDQKQHVPTLSVFTNVIERQIHEGLIAQALMLDHETGSNLAAQVPSAERLGVNIVSGIPFMLPKGGTVSGIAVKNLIFSIDAELGGHWFAGQLRARGHGHIKPLLPRDLARIQEQAQQYQQANQAKVSA